MKQTKKRQRKAGGRSQADKRLGGQPENDADARPAGTRSATKPASDSPRRSKGKGRN